VCRCYPHKNRWVIPRVVYPRIAPSRYQLLAQNRNNRESVGEMAIRMTRMIAIVLLMITSQRIPDLKVNQDLKVTAAKKNVLANGAIVTMAENAAETTAITDPDAARCVLLLLNNTNKNENVY